MQVNVRLIACPLAYIREPWLRFGRLEADLQIDSTPSSWLICRLGGHYENGQDARRDSKSTTEILTRRFSPLKPAGSWMQKLKEFKNLDPVDLEMIWSRIYAVPTAADQKAPLIYTGHLVLVLGGNLLSDDKTVHDWINECERTAAKLQSKLGPRYQANHHITIDVIADDIAIGNRIDKRNPRRTYRIYGFGSMDWNAWITENMGLQRVVFGFQGSQMQFQCWTRDANQRKLALFKNLSVQEEWSFLLKRYISLDEADDLVVKRVLPLTPDDLHSKLFSQILKALVTDKKVVLLVPKPSDDGSVSKMATHLLLLRNGLISLMELDMDAEPLGFIAPHISVEEPHGASEWTALVKMHVPDSSRSISIPRSLVKHTRVFPVVDNDSYLFRSWPIHSLAGKMCKSYLQQIRAPSIEKLDHLKLSLGNYVSLMKLGDARVFPSMTRDQIVLSYEKLHRDIFDLLFTYRTVSAQHNEVFQHFRDKTSAAGLVDAIKAFEERQRDYATHDAHDEQCRSSLHEHIAKKAETSAKRAYSMDSSSSQPVATKRKASVAQGPSRQYRPYLQASTIPLTAAQKLLLHKTCNDNGINDVLRNFLEAGDSFDESRELAGRLPGFRPSGWKPPFSSDLKTWEISAKQKRFGSGLDMVEF